jgi:hypothetical protein
VSITTSSQNTSFQCDLLRAPPGRHAPDVGERRGVAQDAAVDAEDLAGDEARLLAREEDDGVGDVVGLAHARCQVVFLEHRDVLLAAELSDVVRQDQTGRDGVAADALLAVLRRDVEGERIDGALRDPVGGVHQVAQDARAGRRVDDRAPAALEHRRDRVLAAQHHAAQVDRHHALPDCEIDLRNLGVVARARASDRGGVVVEHIEPAVAVDGARDHVPHLVFVAHVDGACGGAGRARRGFDRLHGLLGAALVEVGDDDARALARERERSGPADPGGRARDDGDLVGESHRVSFPSRPVPSGPRV